MSRLLPSTGKRPTNHRWTADEIRSMSVEDYELNETEIVEAMRAGTVQRPSPGPNPRSVS